MQMFTPFNSIAVFCRELRNIPRYVNIVNIELVLFHHRHIRRDFKDSIRYFLNALDKITMPTA